MPVWLVFALGGTVWLITLGLFVKLFRRTFGFDEAHLPLFVFMAGSPFFLKNFMHTLGHFDIYGCAFAIVPAADSGALAVATCCSPTLFSIILILIHHIHLLMYVPTIAVIVVLRYYLVQGVTPAKRDRRGSPRSLAIGHAVLRRAILGIDGGPRGGVRSTSAGPHGRSDRAPTC